MAKRKRASMNTSEGPWEAPALPYEPRGPRRYNPPIGLIGCGGITEQHLTAYRQAGFRIVAMCDCNRAAAELRRDAFYPSATVYSDYRELLDQREIEVVDVATHVDIRPEIVEASLRAKKHVLSQKPFALDLDRGEKLVQLARRMGVRLAVNQNARWAPHFSYIRSGIAKGLIGEVESASMGVHWNHDWVAGTPFDSIRHLILFDFAIHWFDFVATFMGDRKAKRVYAANARASEQRAKPPLSGHVIIEYDGALVTLVFDGFTRFGPLDQMYIVGSKGTFRSTGADTGSQSVTLSTAKGSGSPTLKGSWFPDGFRGTMSELLRAIEEGREPSNSAKDNLRGLALCFAACRSADTGVAQVPGKVRRLEE